jgi:pathogen-inducible salicylic acid glucosyltransferase
VTRFVVGSTKPCLGSSPVHVVVFSDGCDKGGPAELGGHRGPYFQRLEEAGSVALDELVWEEAEQGRPATVVLYDTFMPWVPQLAPQIDESR